MLVLSGDIHNKSTLDPLGPITNPQFLTEQSSNWTGKPATSSIFMTHEEPLQIIKQLTVVYCLISSIKLSN